MSTSNWDWNRQPAVHRPSSSQLQMQWQKQSGRQSKSCALESPPSMKVVSRTIISLLISKLRTADWCAENNFALHNWAAATTIEVFSITGTRIPAFGSLGIVCGQNSNG